MPDLAPRTSRASSGRGAGGLKAGRWHNVKRPRAADFKRFLRPNVQVSWASPGRGAAIPVRFGSALSSPDPQKIRSTRWCQPNRRVGGRPVVPKACLRHDARRLAAAVNALGARQAGTRLPLHCLHSRNRRQLDMPCRQRTGCLDIPRNRRLVDRRVFGRRITSAGPKAARQVTIALVMGIDLPAQVQQPFRGRRRDQRVVECPVAGLDVLRAGGAVLGQPQAVIGGDLGMAAGLARADLCPSRALSSPVAQPWAQRT